MPFWIIGYRYRCPQCKHPKTGKATVTWRSWDHRILNVLPPALAAEFPALLTHRSGISKAVFSWMCSCIQNGMGVKQILDSLRVQHLLCYDELHLQYLNSLVTRRGLASWHGIKYNPFLPFDDTSTEGYHGYVLSAQLLRNIYDYYIEEHRPDITQHMAMLTADIIAIDHSHKVCKSASYNLHGTDALCRLQNMLQKLTASIHSLDFSHTPTRRAKSAVPTLLPQRPIHNSSLDSRKLATP
jgi:hypothetical protein